MWSIKPTIIKDLILGMTFEFHVSKEGEPTLYVYPNESDVGMVSVGCRRDICFTKNGEEAGGGTMMCQCPAPRPSSDMSDVTIDDVLGAKE